MTQAAESQDYVLAASGREAHEIKRLELLQEIFDPASHRRLDLVKAGWRCLEIGAGRGSIARFLSDRVGPKGEVVAADIDIGPLSKLNLPNGKVVKHNILTDPHDNVGGNASFDLIHARFLLQHLFDRQDAAIVRMAELLKPGGWLVIEDLDTDVMGAADPAHPLSEAYNQLITHGVAFMRSSRTVDPTAGQAMAPRFKRAGLVNIRHESYAQLDAGGGPLCRWYIQSTEGTRGQHGNDAAIDLTHKALNDPDFWLLGGLHHCAWGQKAG